MNTQTTKMINIIFVSLMFNFGLSQTSLASEQVSGVSYKTVTVDGLDIFYREAGNPERPTILLMMFVIIQN